MLDSGVDPNLQSGLRNSTPLVVAAHYGQFKVCKELLARGAKILDSSRGVSEVLAPALNFAVRGGSLDIIHLFLYQLEIPAARQTGLKLHISRNNLRSLSFCQYGGHQVAT